MLCECTRFTITANRYQRLLIAVTCECFAVVANFLCFTSPCSKAEDVGNELVVLEAIEGSYEIDEDPQYLRSLMFSALHFLVEKSQLYALKDYELRDWLKVSKGHSQRLRLPVVVGVGPLRIVIFFAVIRLQWSSILMLETNKIV